MPITKTLYALAQFALLLLPAIVPSAAAESVSQPSAPKVCPAGRPLTTDELAALKTDLDTEVLVAKGANALVGVDVLGRIAIAIDADQDGTSEQLLLYTDKERLSGPWAKTLRDASIRVTNGTVLIASRPDNFALSLAVSIAEMPTAPRWVTSSVKRSGGKELVRLWDDLGRGIALSALDHNSIHSWPSVFWDDLLAQLPAGTGSAELMGGCGSGGQCCDDRICDAGGFPTSSCGIGGCTGSPSSCSISGCTGLDPSVFACCYCDQADGHKAKCRCKACTCGPCP